MNLPAQLGGYRVLARIGSGGMAEVFAGERVGASGFRKPVAIKALLPERADEPELQRQLIAEAKLGATLHHANLVEVLDLGVDDGRYFMVMERVDGLDLRRALVRSRPAPGVALAIVDAVAAALAHLHRARDERGRPLGIVHRDVTPSNILLSRQGEVKLADYGIAKATAHASQTAAGVVRGKFAYLSPEQVEGAALSGGSDQFALGVVAVELLTGSRPFEADDVATTLERIRRAAPRLDGVPESLQPMLRRVLARVPAERFEGMDELRRALAAARAGLEPAGDASIAAWVQAPPAAHDRPVQP